MFLRLFLPAALLLTPAVAQSNTFDLQSAGRSIGRATDTLIKAKSGYKLSARYSTHIAGNEADFDDEFKLSDTDGYLEGSTSNIASQLHTSYIPKARTEMVIGMVQAGVQDSQQFLPSLAHFVYPYLQSC